MGCKLHLLLGVSPRPEGLIWIRRQREDSSPASFEKALSTLSIKITESQTRLERARATSRRVRVLWTLYLSFAYLIYAIVLLLVVGYQNLSPWEWAGIGCSPFA